MRETRLVLIGLVAWLAITAAWWLLALWPIGDAPSWLERTRFVCFGVGETGLPDQAGWIGLIAGPLGMLAILLVGCARSVVSLFERARSSRIMAATLSTIAIGIVSIAMFGVWRVRTAHASTLEIDNTQYVRIDRPAAELQLTGQDGAIHSLAIQRGRPVVVTFAYAHCETVCPLVVSHILKAQRSLANTSSSPIVMIVTVDPWRDTPSRLPSVAAAWHIPERDAWVLSGPVERVNATLAAWSVLQVRDSKTGEITHPSLSYIIDRDGKLVFTTTAGAETIAALLRGL
jgi:cytochrome oxidase Cu insertion factor (SCO1/SenC/PrrC family)